jgi:hypothetical protein
VSTRYGLVTAVWPYWGLPDFMMGVKTLYVPLDYRNLEFGAAYTGPAQYDAANLPLRTHLEFMAQAHEVQNTATDAEEKRLSQKYGIKGVPLLSTLSSLAFPTSFPYMHMIWENLIPNLVLFWTGQYKDLDHGGDVDYRLMPTIWDVIGEAYGASS